MINLPFFPEHIKGFYSIPRYIHIDRYMGIFLFSKVVKIMVSRQLLRPLDPVSQFPGFALDEYRNLR